MECHHCGKKKHIKRFCYKWKRKNAEKDMGEKRRGEDESSISIVTGGDLLLAYESEDSTTVVYDRGRASLRLGGGFLCIHTCHLQERVVLYLHSECPRSIKDGQHGDVRDH
ncbi:hypothetical protein Nepgr_024893 [Nepenthes gracilis]|uniref:Uncharacterized protein n=1 Tax=Nepenthes gracilis TaxID=150966 RepID=A0AAD3T4W1_NEPGR|nr:hypothetical protein Nepgr_024893 [Nepenthes gracilis]